MMRVCPVAEAVKMHDVTFFNGGVFHESIDGGRSGAEIELTHDRGQAVTGDGERFYVQYSECQLEVGGYNDRMVYCRNEDRSLTAFCDDRKFPAASAYASGGVLEEQLQEKTKTLKSQNRRGHRMVLGFLVGCVVCIVVAYYGIQSAGVAAVKAVPVSVDEQIGKHGYETMDPGGPELNDEVVVAAIRQMVDRLAPHAAIPELKFEVHVIQSAEVNAFCLPGGVMVVYTGLIQAAEQPEQVAGVLAHEMAHATLRHGLQRISQSLGIAAAANLLIGDVEGILVLGSELFQLASINSYSRGQESDADAEGVRMMHAAAFDPLSMAQFFEIMKEQAGNLPAELAWISTHPDHDARIISIREQMGTLPPQQYRSLDVDLGRCPVANSEEPRRMIRRLLHSIARISLRDYAKRPVRRPFLSLPRHGMHI
jgi:beta-barrel assembly-enhancing protease